MNKDDLEDGALESAFREHVEEIAVADDVKEKLDKSINLFQHFGIFFKSFFASFPASVVEPIDVISNNSEEEE